MLLEFLPIVSVENSFGQTPSAFSLIADKKLEAKMDKNISNNMVPSLHCFVTQSGVR